MKTIAIAAMITASGCTFGFGSPFVGQWRARDVVEYEVCVEDELGQCAETRAVESHEEERSFWGWMMSFPRLGMSTTTLGDATFTQFRMEGDAELMFGRGRFAWGVRGSAVVDLGTDKNAFFTSPLMLMGHVGVTDRLALYGGAGFSPYSAFQRSDGTPDGVDVQKSNALFRGLLGLHLVGSRSNQSSRILYTLEADTMRSGLGGGYRSFSLTFSIGAFL